MSMVCMCVVCVYVQSVICLCGVCTCAGICGWEEPTGQEFLSPDGARPGSDIFLAWIWDSFLLAIVPFLSRS